MTWLQLQSPSLHELHDSTQSSSTFQMCSFNTKAKHLSLTAIYSMYCVYYYSYYVNSFALDMSILLAFHSYDVPVYSNAFQIVQQKDFLCSNAHFLKLNFSTNLVR